jgi:hypothetical protein
MQVLDESCTEVFLFEKKQAYFSKTGREMPKELEEEAKIEKANGAKASRDHGNKHFNKVGFTGSQNKKMIARWATDDQLLNQIVKHQKQQKNRAEDVFGRMGQKVLEQVSMLKNLGEYKALLQNDDWYAYQAEMQQRNSSAQWEDDSEF